MLLQLLRGLTVITLGLAIGPVHAQVTPEIAPGLKPYSSRVGKLEGKVSTGNSETFEKLMKLWIAGFHSHHRSIHMNNEVIKYTDASNAFAKDMLPIPEGADLVALSYPLAEKQIQEIKRRSGNEPVKIPVALDGVVIFVNHKNTLPALTLDQVARIFSVDSKEDGAITQWNQIGVNGPLAASHLNLYTRDPESGTYAAFKEMALKGREQRKTPFVQPGSRSVALEVGSDERGIGYAAMGFATKKVRVVPIAKHEGMPAVPANNETVARGEYPLSRTLYMYAMPEPNGVPNPIIKEFMAYVLSADGQHIVKDEGFVPLPGNLIEQAMRMLEGGPSASSLSMKSNR